MRNLKRALSLALATVMTLGLMVVGTGAVGYTDVTSEDNQEAIEVLQEVGIMTGVTDDEFNPDGLVTRNQMAVIMSQLLNLDYNYYRGINSFTDVPAWAAPYVAACVAEGVTAGIGGGLYGGENNVTAAQAALMLMKALGYFQYQEDFNPDWQVATIRQGSYINLFDQVDANAEQALTRGQVAQMVLNALKANMVTFTGDVGTQLTLPDGTTYVSGYRAEYTARTNASQKYNKIDTGTTTILVDNGQYFVQLGEELYDGDLELDNDAADVFGRPARMWSYDGEKIGTYVKDELLREEYTEKVTGRMLYDLLGSSTIRDYDFYIYIDGVEATEDTQADLGTAYFTTGRMVRGNTNTVGETGNSVLTQVFVDPDAGDKGEVVISIINTYLAVAENDYDDRDEALDLEVWGINEVNVAENIYVKNTGDSTGTLTDGFDAYTEPFTVENEDINVEKYQEDDIVLVTVADGAIQTVADPEVLADVVITGFKSGRGGNLTTDGNRYDYNDAAAYDEDALIIYTTGGTVNLEDTTYNVYLDQYGNVAGVEEVDAAKQYVFITGVDSTYSNRTNRNYDATGIFLDGTIDGSMEIDARDTRDAGVDFDVDSDEKTWDARNNDGDTNTLANVNQWYSYTVDRNGVYTLHPVADTGANQRQAAVDVFNLGGLRINEKNIDIPVGGGRYAFGDSETVYLNVSVANIRNDIAVSPNNVVTVIDDVESVTTGIRNVDINVSDVGANTADDGPANYYPTQEVFPLWDSDNWLIGVVVIGEDMGISSDYAYVHTDGIKQETYTDADGNHHWFRDVLIDGKITELEYVDDSVNVLGNSAADDGNSDNTLDQGYWYRVFYNGDGTVRRTESVAQDGDIVTSIPTILTINTDSLEVYRQNLTAVGADGVADSGDEEKLEYSNGSLYVIDENGRNGFSVRPDVKIAYINAKAAGNNYDEVVDGLEGVDDLRTALRRVNDNFTGIVNVIFEDNSAAVIVLHCQAQDPGYNPGGNIGYGFKLTGVENVTKEVGGSGAQWMEADLVGTGYLPAGSSVVVDLMKQNNSEGDAVVDTHGYNSYQNVAANSVQVNDVDGANPTTVTIPESGNYYLVIKIVDANGNVLDSVQTPSRYFTVTP